MSERRTFSVAVFARHAGRILLIRHKRLGKWLPVGGELEEGETPLEAARRELREETGLEGRFEQVVMVDGTPPGYIGYEEHLAGSKGLHMNFAFVADVDSEQVVSNGEYDEYQWTSTPTAFECPINVRELGLIALHGGDHALLAIARAWLKAFNDRDLDGLLALYADDAVHTSPKLREQKPETKGEVRGKAALREWWSGAMDRLPGLRYEEQRLTAGGAQVFMEYLRVNPGEEPYTVAEVLVCEAGRIVASHVYHG